MVEHWRIVHVVLQQSQPVVLSPVHLTQQVKLLKWLLQQEVAIRADVPIRNVLAFLVEEVFLGGLLVSVVVAFEAAGHSKVIKEEGMLVDVLEDAELALVERQLHARLEVQVWVQAGLFVFLPG